MAVIWPHTKTGFEAEQRQDHFSGFSVEGNVLLKLDVRVEDIGCKNDDQSHDLLR